MKITILIIFLWDYKLETTIPTKA